MTFCASVNAILHAGATPVLADTLPNGCLDPAAVAAALSPRTKALLPVHYAGRACDMDALGTLAARHGLLVIEDCAHALETEWRGRKAGQFGDFGCFSFYATKNVTTGEGGMVTCQNVHDADEIKTLALHGMSEDAWHRHRDEGLVHYEVEAPGFKYNLTDLAAALGIHQLARVETAWRRRSELWSYYLTELRDLPLGLPAPDVPNTRHARHLFTCLVNDSRTRVTRDELVAELHDLRIGTGVHYRPVHLHAYYRRAFGHREGDFPNAEWIGERTFSLPLSLAVSDDDAADVVRALKLILAA
jgi:dTDP-4-amino-4,6-dideoxygalactose transaminase